MAHNFCEVEVCILVQAMHEDIGMLVDGTICDSDDVFVTLLVRNV